MPTIITRGAGSAVGFGLFGSSAVTDPYFFYNTLLLPGNGTNGAQNNTFLDSSTNNFTITRNGNTTQGTFTPYGSNWSNYFDGSGDSLTAPSGACISGTGDFTAECWIFPTTVPGSYNIIGCSDSSNGLTMFGLNANGTIFYGRSGVSVQGTTSNSLNYNTWNHIAISRSSSTLKMFINGVQGFSGTETYSYASGTVRIGTDIGGSQLPYTGYISNFRIIQGSALYTSNFTPSTTPLTAISGTSLLTCQSNRFIDNSSNAFTITRNGDTSVQRFSPFNPSAPYAAGTIGGSGYFDGSGDYLSVANNAALNLGSSDYTIECWFYAPSAPTANDGLFTKGNTTSVGSEAWTLEFTNTSGNIGFSVGAYNSMSAYLLSSSTAAVLNTWNHVAVVRNGTAHTMYLNGASVATATASYTVTSAGSLYLGTGWYAPSTRDFIGYISNARLVIGTAVYTGAFTSPTAPLTAIANTQLLCSFTNGGIIDNAMMNDLETVGNAQISTTQSKFGGASMSFPGSSYLRSPSSVVNAYGTGNLTIEGWFYTTDGASTMIMVDQRTSGTTEVVPTVYLSGGTINVYVNGANLISGGSYTTSQWNHFAFCRSGTSSKLFLNGTQTGSTASDSNSYATSAISIGAYTPSPQQYFNGYIDDLRITKGYARYTANFTPPTAAFPLS